MIHPIDWLKTRVRTPWDGAWMAWTGFAVALLVGNSFSVVGENEGGGVLAMLSLALMLLICNLQNLEIRYQTGRGAR